jgi:putative Mn2+ efflux pump MntP
MLSVFLIGIGLSMDALAVSVANGLTLRNFRIRHALWMGAYFGFFQFLMPLIGSFLAGTVSGYVSALGPYISFFLLLFIGGRMIWDSLRGDGEGSCMTELSHRRLLTLAVATSIDALAVGVSFAFMDIDLLPSCLLIGGTTFAVSFIGAELGGHIPGISCRHAGLLGGLVLVGIGVKILVEGVFL